MTWPALFLIGWLIYEVTAQPDLGAAIVCAKFGWNDFCAALWLRRKDPDRGRARACFWFYLASGLWKMAITATLAIFAFAFLAANQQNAQKPRADGLPPWFGAVLLTALMGFGLSALTTLIALQLALRYRIKFWLSSSVHRFRRRNSWPPYDVWKLGPNHAGRVLLTSLILVLVTVTFTLSIPLGAAIGQHGNFAIVAIVVVAACACTVAILIFRDILNHRFVAHTPWQCWGIDEAADDELVNHDPGLRTVVTDSLRRIANTRL
jgi:hypothetical protein